jgi:RimJ/RimL family protein N-acetyltransferase
MQVCRDLAPKVDATLSNQFVLLRRFHDSDVSELYRAVRESIPQLSPWFAWATPAYTLEDARNFLHNQRRWRQEGQVYNFAIIDRASGAFCGGCLLNNINQGNRFANLAYWVRSTQTGRGLASAAASLAAAFGFKQLGLNRVEIVMAKENLASMRVAEKIGAKRERELRRRIAVRDRVYDALMYSLIAVDLSDLVA